MTRAHLFPIVAVLIGVSSAQAAPPDDEDEGAPKIRPPEAKGSSHSPPNKVRAAMTAAPATAFGGAPYVVELRAAPSARNREGEEHIAVDPRNPQNLVAATFTYAITNDAQNMAVVSFDDGQTWSESQGPHGSNNLPQTGDGKSWQVSGDPVLAVDNAGNAFMVAIYFNRKNNANGLYVSSANLSAGAGFAFTAASTWPIAANTKPKTNTLEDKPWIAVDNTGKARDGTVYVAWARYISNSPSIFFTRSTDHGRTWSAPKQISTNAQAGNVQGAQIAVGPDGEVYVVFRVNDPATATFMHYLAKSSDGVTFAAPAPISPPFIGLTFASPYRRLSFPALAVSPIKGANGAQVSVAWASQPDDVLGAEVYFIASDDGGASFSAPVVLNDDPTGHQFMPGLTADASGAIHASWFETRNFPGDPSHWDIYASYSLDGGLTWAPNARVNATPGACDPTSDFIGDYSGIAAEGNSAHPVWTSGGVFTPAFYGTLETATLGY
jgi:hypothetical protein